MEKIYQVSEPFFEKLRTCWLNSEKGLRNSTVINRIEKEFSLKSDLNRPLMTLSGRSGLENHQEQIVGNLKAIAKGIVVLDTEHSGIILELSGLLERKGEDFILRPFRGLMYSSLYIWPTADFSNIKSIKDCPVFINYQIGGGMTGWDMMLGIDAERWNLLSSWFDEWLPQDEKDR